MSHPSAGKEVNVTGISRAIASARILLAAAIPALALPSIALTQERGQTIRVSESTAGAEADMNSFLPAISRTGRYVAFYSNATNLLDDAVFLSAEPRLYVHDRILGETRFVSSNIAFAPTFFELTISGAGRFLTHLAIQEGQHQVVINDRSTASSEVVSVGPGGVLGNSNSADAHISGNGRFIVFTSGASNLVEGDTNEAVDVFVHDRRSGVTERVSLEGVGLQIDGPSLRGRISRKGRWIAFSSAAEDFVDDGSGRPFLPGSVLVRDRRTGLTERLSLEIETDFPDAEQTLLVDGISANGRYVVLTAETSLFDGLQLLEQDVFVYDRTTAATERISIDRSGDPRRAGGGGSGCCGSISRNGRFVTFESFSSELVDDDTNNRRDVFLRDRRRQTTRRISVEGPTRGFDLDPSGDSLGPVISPNGQWIAFQSSSPVLISTDFNNQEDIFLHRRAKN